MRRSGRRGFVTLGSKLAFLSAIDGSRAGSLLLRRAELKPRFPRASPDLLNVGTGSSWGRTQFDCALFAGPRRGASTGRGAFQPTSHPLAVFGAKVLREVALHSSLFHFQVL
jgi:hypothetical protein